jgi:RHS repeat-associated protein
MVQNSGNNLRFAGQYYDVESGLHYNYHRYYDPSIGRYLTPDPIGLEGGINLYAYVSGNPVNLVDPYGLQSLAVPGGATGPIPAGHPVFYPGSYENQLIAEDVLGIIRLMDPRPLINDIGNLIAGDTGDGDSCKSFSSESTPGMPDPDDDDDPIIFRGKKINKDLANRLGIDRHRLRESIHKIKYNAGHGGRDNVNITKKGNVFSQKSGEYIENVFDELTFR